MGLIADAFVEFLPEYAEDIKSNLAAVLADGGSPGLTGGQALAAALAAAYATRQPEVVRWAETVSRDRLSAEEARGAKAACCLMAMNNVYYRFTDLAGDEEYRAMPTKLRMSLLAKPGMDKTEFEICLLAVSVVNGCSYCVTVHAKKLAASGLGKDAVQSVARIAAVVNGAAQAAFIAGASQ